MRQKACCVPGHIGRARLKRCYKESTPHQPYPYHSHLSPDETKDDKKATPYSKTDLPSLFTSGQMHKSFPTCKMCRMLFTSPCTSQDLSARTSPFQSFFYVCISGLAVSKAAESSMLEKLQHIKPPKYLWDLGYCNIHVRVLYMNSLKN